MPQRDVYHEPVKQALIKDGWTITHDPYVLEFGEERVFIDLAAERIIAAERAGTRIAVEIKTFAGPSVIADVEQALGQYLLYRAWMSEVDAQRQIYLAISNETAASVFARPAIAFLVQQYKLQLVIINIYEYEVQEWNPPIITIT